MRRTTTSALQFLAAGAFVASSLLAPTTAEAANPIDALVDCSDSFWMVACGMEAVEPRTPIVIPAGETRIDSVMVCTVDTEALRICHT